MPAARVRSSAYALRLSENTPAISAWRLPAAIASIRAWRLDPRPETSTASRSGASANAHALRAARRFDRADLEVAEPERVERARGGGQIRARDDHGVADAAVERAPHLVPGHVAGALEPIEHRRHGPGARVDGQAQAFGHDADDVLGEPAAGDVRHAVHRDLAHQLQHRLHVDARGRHERVRQRAIADTLAEVGVRDGQDLPDQRVAVRVRAARLDADDRVARLDARPVDQRGFLHRADAEPREVVLARRVHVRHLGRLAADQRAAGLLAARGDAGDHLYGGVDLELAGREVVEEEQRLGALHQHVVHAHADEVDADGVVPAESLGELELGADAVRARDQHRFAVAPLELEQRAEAAEPGHHFRPARARDQRLDALDHGFARVDVDAGVAVAQGPGLLAGHGRRRAGRAQDHRGTSPPGQCRPPRSMDVHREIGQHERPFEASSPPMRFPMLCCALLVLAACLPGETRAQDVALYTGEAPVQSQDEAERARALPQALTQALVRVSGDGGIGADPALAPKLEQAPALMRQYSYRQVTE